MLVIMLLFALIRTLYGVPLSSPMDTPDGSPILNPRDTQTHLGQRGVNDIIISCFATILACTWGAVHPNIPATTDCWWTLCKRQLITTIYALLAPEAISSWALKQRLGARDIMNDYNKRVGSDERDTTHSFVAFMQGLFKNSPMPRMYEKGKGPRWTLTHGFLVQMGGFVLSERGRPIRTLTVSDGRLGLNDLDNSDDMVWNIEHKIIDAPLLTDDDIHDRSKGDTISKTLIVLQTTWFILQCVARWSQHLPVTELEVVTLGFAILNGITYALWWHKPQNVRRPVFFEKKESYLGSNGDVAESHLVTTPTGERQPGWLRKRLREDIEELSSVAPWKFPWLVLLRLLAAMLRPVSKMTAYDRNTYARPHHRHRVSMFFSGGARDPEIFIINIAIGLLFGSVHLVSGWYLEFPSRTEMWLWRASSIEITIGPIFFQTWSYLESYPGPLFNIVGGFCIVGLPFYILFRIALVTLSLSSLRALPAAALLTIDWTSFIPHL